MAAFAYSAFVFKLARLHATVAAFVVLPTGPFLTLSSGVLLPKEKLVLLTTKRFRLLPRGIHDRGSSRFYPKFGVNSIPGNRTILTKESKVLVIVRPGHP